MVFDIEALERELKDKGRVYTLDNGLTVVEEDNPGMGLSVGKMGLWAGSAKERPEDAGVMHFLEHMAFNGSREYPNRTERERIAGLLGLDSNASTSHSMVNFPVFGANPSSYLLPGNFGESMRIVTDMMFFPLHREEDIEKERAIIQREREEREGANRGHPFYRQRKVVGSRLYGNNLFLLREVIGTEDSIDNLTAARLKEYHEKYFVGNNTVLSLGGELNGESGVRKQILEVIGQIPAGERTAWMPIREEEPFDEKEMIRFKSPSPGTATVSFDFHVPHPYHAEGPEIEMLTRVLVGSGLQSLLYRELRERRSLVYGINESEGGHSRTGIRGFNYRVKKEFVDQSLESVGSVIQAVREGKFEEDLIRSIKAALIPQKISEYRNPGWVLRELEYRLNAERMGHEPISSFENINRFLDMSKEDVVRVANKYLTNRFLLTIAS